LEFHTSQNASLNKLLFVKFVETVKAYASMFLQWTVSWRDSVSAVCQHGLL